MVKRKNFFGSLWPYCVILYKIIEYLTDINSMIKINGIKFKFQFNLLITHKISLKNLLLGGALMPLKFLRNQKNVNMGQ